MTAINFYVYPDLVIGYSDTKITSTIPQSGIQPSMSKFLFDGRLGFMGCFHGNANIANEIRGLIFSSYATRTTLTADMPKLINTAYANWPAQNTNSFLEIFLFEIINNKLSATSYTGPLFNPVTMNIPCYMQSVPTVGAIYDPSEAYNYQLMKNQASANNTVGGFCENWTFGPDPLTHNANFKYKNLGPI